MGERITLIPPEQIAQLPPPLIVGIGDEMKRVKWFLSHQQGTLICVNPLFDQLTQIRSQRGDTTAFTLPGRLDQTNLPSGIADRIECGLVLSYYPVIYQYEGNLVPFFDEMERIAKPGATLEILDTLYIVAPLQEILKQLHYHTNLIIPTEIGRAHISTPV